MSNKKRHIQNANLILEKRYLKEQGLPQPLISSSPPPPQTGQTVNTNVPQNVVQTNTQLVSPSGETTTTTTTRKMNQNILDSLPKCSNTKMSNEVVSAMTYNNFTIYTKNNGLFCKDRIVED
jgi:hypothetical protein